jgi:hypothetical protein
MTTSDQAAAVIKCEADIARLVRKMANDERRLEGLRRQLAELKKIPAAK